jgi:hypothetical protein
MASELRWEWLVRSAAGTVLAHVGTESEAAAWQFGGNTIERLALLTPAAKAVIEAAVALVTDDPSDPWGYQKDVQFDTLRGEVAHYIATRGTDAN